MGGLFGEASPVLVPTQLSMLLSSNVQATRWDTAGGGWINYGTPASPVGLSSVGQNPVPTAATLFAGCTGVLGTSAAAINTIIQSGLRNSQNRSYYQASGNAKMAGFQSGILGGFSASRVGARFFIGFCTVQSSLPSAEPSSRFNMVGFGADSTDTDLQFMYNNGVGSATKIDLGINWTTWDSSLLQFQIICPPSGTPIQAQITNLETNATFAKTVLATDPKYPGSNVDVYGVISIDTGPTVSTAVNLMALQHILLTSRYLTY